MACKMLDRGSYLELTLCWKYGVILGFKSHQENYYMLVMKVSISGMSVSRSNTSNLTKHLKESSREKAQVCQVKWKRDIVQQQILNFCFSSMRESPQRQPGTQRND